jgi:hypothetical protein
MTALKGVMMLAKIIEDKKLTVMATQARYNMAYEYARKLAWWNVDQSCGRGSLSLPASPSCFCHRPN